MDLFFSAYTAAPSIIKVSVSLYRVRIRKVIIIFKSGTVFSNVGAW